MFDLPTSTASERKAAAGLRRLLLEEGFSMDQYSVYTRCAFSNEDAKARISRIKRNVPRSGRVVLLSITESQCERRVLTGAPARGSVAPSSQMVLEF